MLLVMKYLHSSNFGRTIKLGSTLLPYQLQLCKYQLFSNRNTVIISSLCCLVSSHLNLFMRVGLKLFLLERSQLKKKLRTFIGALIIQMPQKWLIRVFFFLISCFDLLERHYGKCSRTSTASPRLKSLRRSSI